MTPPQVTAPSEARLRSLSNPELAAEWLIWQRQKIDTKPILDEFNRRYWVEQEERAEGSGTLRIHPAWRVLNVDPDPKSKGPDPFAHEAG